MASESTDKSNRGFINDVESPPPQYSETVGVHGGRDNLPSYESAAANQEPPPSYESLYGRIKAAKTQSSGIFTFFKNFIIIILSTLGFTIFIGIFMAIPLAMLIMGAIHLNDCSAERMIPIYLIVAGCFGTAKNLFSLVQRCRKTEQEREEDQKNINPIESMVHCFLFAWFITGCVYIYRTKNHFQSIDPGRTNFCNYELYWFAFWITTAVYIITFASCMCVCCMGFLAACFGDSK